MMIMVLKAVVEPDLGDSLLWCYLEEMTVHWSENNLFYEAGAELQEKLPNFILFPYMKNAYL